MCVFVCVLCGYRIASMAEYQRRKREEESSAGKDDESQKFFAGGSEHRYM